MNSLQEATEFEMARDIRKVGGLPPRRGLKGAELLEYMVVGGVIILVIIGILNTGFKNQLQTIVDNILSTISKSTTNLGG